jgi:hypothetical protein
VEFVGYCARASASNHTDRIGPYVTQNLFILLPPALFAATIYMCLGRIIRLVGGDQYSVIKPRRLTAVFITGDLLSFWVQGGSAYPSILGQTKPIWATIAAAMIIGGLAIQLISFGLFFLSAIIFHRRIHRNPTRRSFEVDPKWVHGLYMLYSISLLIILRSIFRLVEYCLGTTGVALSTEWTLYVFDSVPMFLVAIIFFFKYPSNLVPESDGSVQLEGQIVGETLISGSK